MATQISPKDDLNSIVANSNANNEVERANANEFNDISCKAETSVATKDKADCSIIEADEDLLLDYTSDCEEVVLTHCKIRDIAKLGLKRVSKLKYLCLRQNIISEIQENASLPGTLTELDLYDNLIREIENIDHLKNLTYLDLSFNKIKKLKNLSNFTKLESLYLVQNKISHIENLEMLTSLKTLELGGNHLRKLENLECLHNLKDLWVGKNKITEIPALNLPKLELLSIQSNRLTEFGFISTLKNSLKELYISHNGLTSLVGIQDLELLEILDISNNSIEHLDFLQNKKNLRDFWAGYNKISNFHEVARELGPLNLLETVYFEKNPIETNDPANYRRKVMLALPQVKQIDATACQL